jgi:predicted nucleotidyltransferase
MSELKTLSITIPKEEIEQFCQRHHIRKLSLFGSVLRDDFTPESDVDFLVEFEPGKTPGFFKIVSMEMELSELLEGRKIDLRTPNELSVYFRDRVMAEAVVQYDSN